MTAAEAFLAIRKIAEVTVEGPTLRIVGRESPVPPMWHPRLQRHRAAFAEMLAWPVSCIASQARFGCDGARLYPPISKRVLTPEGPGVLYQVLDTAAVRLHGQGKLTFFPIYDVRPRDSQAAEAQAMATGIPPLAAAPERPRGWEGRASVAGERTSPPP